MKKKMCGAALLALVVTGCATTKPEMPEEQYQKAANIWWLIHACVREGYMAPEMSVKAKQFYYSGVIPYSVNEELLKSKIIYLDKHTPSFTKQDCNMLAMYSAEHSNKVQVQNAMAAQESQQIQESIQQNRIRNTYCNRIGSQVMCNTY